jgi:hypothetical protein
MPEITITVPDEVAARLAVLAAPAGTAADVLALLADHAQQGVYRPGSWERGWTCSVFGEDWLERLEPDTRPDMLSGDGRVIFDRPREDGSDEPA